MKRCIVFILLVLCLCSCDKSEPAELSETISTPEPYTPTAEQAEITGISGSIQRDSTGTLWTTMGACDGLSDIRSLLPADTGYVYSFFMDDDAIYYAARPEQYSLDNACLYRCDRSGGDTLLLADTGLPGSIFCLVGDHIFFESSDGIRAVDAENGGESTVIPDAANLLAADAGYFYYATADGTLYRNDSTLLRQSALGNITSMWLVVSGDNLCRLCHDTEGTDYLCFSDAASGAETNVSLEFAPEGMCVSAGIVYVPQTAKGVILTFDISTGQQTGTLSLPEGTCYCIPLCADGQSIYYETMDETGFVPARTDISVS